MKRSMICTQRSIERQSGELTGKYSGKGYIYTYYTHTCTLYSMYTTQKKNKYIIRILVGKSMDDEWFRPEHCILDRRPLRRRVGRSCALFIIGCQDFAKKRVIYCRIGVGRSCTCT
jgi:hypothetical protein